MNAQVSIGSGFEREIVSDKLLFATRQVLSLGCQLKSDKEVCIWVHFR